MHECNLHAKYVSHLRSCIFFYHAGQKMGHILSMLFLSNKKLCEKQVFKNFIFLGVDSSVLKNKETANFLFRKNVLSVPAIGCLSGILKLINNDEHCFFSVYVPPCTADAAYLHFQRLK